MATLGDLEPRSPLPPCRRPGRLKVRQSPRVGGAGLGGDAGRPDCLHAESTIVTMSQDDKFRQSKTFWAPLMTAFRKFLLPPDPE